jgi:tetratricopeptide (TPR) repeat protein
MTIGQPTHEAPQQWTAMPFPATKTCLADKPWLLALVLVIATFAAYQPMWHAGFIWDDDILIIDNPLIKTSDGLRRLWVTTESQNYYPLTWSLCWLEWRLWGNSAAGYHVANVLLHAINAVLLWVILRRLKIPGAWLAGLVFAIHPVNVATVFWISEQKNTLSMLFYAMAILWYLKFDEEGRRRWYGLSLGAFLLALFSKTAVVMLPVVLLGCVWWCRGRLRWRDLLRSIPFFVLSAIMGLVTIWFEYNRDLGGHPTRTDGFPSHLALAGRAPWFYLCKAFLPFNLNMIYPKWEINPSSWISYLPGMALVGCLTIFWWKRRAWGRPLLFALGYFVVMFFPVLGFFDQGFYEHSLVADHWQYYSIVGAIALVVGAATTIGRRADRLGRSLGVVVVLAVLVMLGMATWTRAGVYARAETLWRDTLAKNPNAWMAHNNLGPILQRSGNVSEAIAQYEQALRIEPDYAEAHNNFGTALTRSGRITEAVAHFEQALRINPDYAEAHYNLGLALVEQSRLREAMEHWERALQINPDFAEAHYNLGLALVEQGRLREAMEHWEQALRINPDFAEAHYNLGYALEQAGKRDEAIGHYEQALRIKPDYTQAQSNLARARSVH